MVQRLPVIYVSAIAWRHHPVEISCIHTDLYHGWQENWLAESERADFQPEFAVNTAAGPVRLPSFFLVVTPEIANELRRAIKADFVSARVTFPFRHPVNPSDGLDRRFQGMQLSPSRLLSAYLKTLNIRDNAPQLILVRPTIGAQQVAHYDDVEQVDIDDDSIGVEHIALSRRMVSDYGIVFDSGFLFTQSAYAAIREHVEKNPFFFVLQL